MSFSDQTCICLLILCCLYTQRERERECVCECGMFPVRDYKSDDSTEPLKSSRLSAKTLLPSINSVFLLFATTPLASIEPSNFLSSPTVSYTESHKLVHTLTHTDTHQTTQLVYAYLRSRVEQVPIRHNTHQSLSSSLFWDVTQRLLVVASWYLVPIKGA